MLIFCFAHFHGFLQLATPSIPNAGCHIPMTDEDDGDKLPAASTPSPWCILQSLHFSSTGHTIKQAHVVFIPCPIQQWSCHSAVEMIYIFSIAYWEREGERGKGTKPRTHSDTTGFCSHYNCKYLTGGGRGRSMRSSRITMLRQPAHARVSFAGSATGWIIFISLVQEQRVS